MREKIPLLLMITVAFLITGNLIGAGILGLPVDTGLAGFIPSLLGMLVIAGAMFFTAVVIGNEAADKRDESFNYPSLYHKYLGSMGKWIAILANVLILYGLLTAYLTGATAIITSLFPALSSKVWVMLSFFIIISWLTISNMTALRKYNAVLMVLLWASFAVIVFMSETHVRLERFAYRDWGFLPVAIPIIVTSFHFHNIIPNVYHGLKWNRSVAWKAMLAGMIIGYIMNALWIQVAIGALPLSGGENSILEAFKHNLPATVPLANLINSSVFVTCSLLFALLAISTSYLANGTGLLGFINDLTTNHFKKSSRLLTVVLTCGPPLIISLIYPNIFLKALDVVGGVGIVILFGILPSIIAIIKPRSRGMRVIGFLVLILFSASLILELGQQSGLLKIHPHVEHLKPHYPHHPRHEGGMIVDMDVNK